MYKINEMFQSIQGEGYYSGTPAIFIRLQGCPVHCKWCDTKNTWKILNKSKISYEELINKTVSNEYWSNINIKQIFLNIHKKKWKAQHVVITGGEPCIYNLLELTEQLEQKGYRCQVETSGTQLINCSLNTWVTLSPKKNKKVLYTSIIRSDEIKFPVSKKEDLLYLKEILLMIKNKKRKRIYLQPISQNKDALETCIKICTINNWKLSIQMHKYLSIQ